MIKKIKLKITLQKIFSYLYLLIIIAVVITLFLTFHFLYTNFYLAITQSQVVLELQGKIVEETVDMNKYNIVIQKIEKKTKVSEGGDIINNPFD